MLESGDQTLFPALRVGHETTSAVVSFLSLCKPACCEAFNSIARIFFYTRVRNIGLLELFLGFRISFLVLI